MVIWMVAGLALVGASQAQTGGSALDQALASQARSYTFARPSPGIHFSPSGAARYAMGNGCIPHVVTGRPAQEFVQPARFSGRGDPDRLHISTDVTLAEDANGSCTVVAVRGDPEGLRQAMLDVIDEGGAQRTPRQDTGPGSRDSAGDFRQELHCLTLNGQPMFLLMSTSSANNRARMMASLGRDDTGGCARVVAP